MFDLVRNNKKFIQIILALIILPFALWGVDSYVRSGDGANAVATVGGVPVGLDEFQQALREQQDRLRPQLGGLDPKLLDSPELRRGVLQELINQRLLALHAAKAHLGVSDAALVDFITSVPSLQEDGKFSRERYEALVAAQGMSVEMFEARVRQDIVMQQAMLPVVGAAVGGRVPAERWLAAQLEERTIGEAILRAEDFAAGTTPDAEAVKRYYEANRSRFEVPEQVRVEYLVLDQAVLAERAQASEEEIKAWYQANEARYKQPEERQASHILIRADKGAPEAELKAAQAKAEEVLARLKAVPGDFAKLAKEFSQDPGSADKGGDLGYFGRGMMVKPFEDATFALKAGELSGVVRSDFGFHIIKLTGIRAEQARPLAAVRAEIAAELKRQAAARLYAESAESFANTVYEQPDSLKPAAEKHGLSVQTSDWLARGAQTIMPPLGHPKLLQAVFSDDAVKHRRNTEAVDVGGGKLISARVVEHRPAAVEPLEKVSGAIEKILAREAAVARATAAGKAQLEKLAKGEKTELKWAAARVVSRLHAPNLTAEAREAVFSAATGALPAYAGSPIPGGYALYRIEKVKPFDAAAAGDAAARAEALRQHYGQIVAQEELVAWLAALRQRYPVEINTALLERKE
ncbi:MAG: SurA N-terminal domain-containing protein [Pseudomonadota bacterium]